MNPKENPATLRFLVPPTVKASIKLSNHLPTNFRRNSLKNASVEFCEGPFGTFSSNEIITKKWALGWLNFSIENPTKLYLVADKSMVTMYCTLKGNVTSEIKGYGKLAIQKNRFGFFYIPPQLKNPMEFSADDYEAVYISFSNELLLDFVDQHSEFKNLFNLKQLNSSSGTAIGTYKMGKEEVKILTDIKQCTLNGPIRNIFIEARIFNLLVCYFEAQEIADKIQEYDHEQKNKLSQIQLYIEENFFLPLKVQSLSRQVGMNLRSFELSFKAYFGYTPKEYIEKVRIERATELLGYVNIPIISIANQVGYADRRYFSSVFRKIRNCTPNEYRQMILVDRK